MTGFLSDLVRTIADWLRKASKKAWFLVIVFILALICAICVYQLAFRAITDDVIVPTLSADPKTAERSDIKLGVSETYQLLPMEDDEGHEIPADITRTNDTDLHIVVKLEDGQLHALDVTIDPERKALPLYESLPTSEATQPYLEYSTNFEGREKYTIYSPIRAAINARADENGERIYSEDDIGHKSDTEDEDSHDEQ